MLSLNEDFVNLEAMAQSYSSSAIGSTALQSCLRSARAKNTPFCLLRSGRQRRAAVEVTPVLDEAEQVGHVLGRDRAFQPFGHQRLAAGAQFVDFRARDDG